MIAVDRKALMPLHWQIYDAYRSAIVDGSLRPGQQIPSTRVLASENWCFAVPGSECACPAFAGRRLRESMSAPERSFPTRFWPSSRRAPQAVRDSRPPAPDLDGFSARLAIRTRDSPTSRSRSRTGAPRRSLCGAVLSAGNRRRCRSRCNRDRRCGWRAPADCCHPGLPAPFPAVIVSPVW